MTDAEVLSEVRVFLARGFRITFSMVMAKDGNQFFVESELGDWSAGVMAEYIWDAWSSMKQMIARAVANGTLRGDGKNGSDGTESGQAAGDPLC